MDVNKPIKVEGEALVEVETDKRKATMSILITESKNTQPFLRLNFLDKLEIGLPGSNYTNLIRKVTTDENCENILTEYDNSLKKHDKRPDKRHPAEQRREANTTKRETGPYPFQKFCMARSWEPLNGKGLPKLIKKGHLEKRTGQPKLLCFPCCNDHKKR